jgi:hypothetical protein
MSRSGKSSSCLGLFIKSWLASALVLSALAALLVGLGIRYLGWSAHAWSDFSAWSSYPVMALLGISALASLLALLVAGLIGAISALMGRGGSGSGKGSSARSRTRAQSQRKTTV